MRRLGKPWNSNGSGSKWIGALKPSSVPTGVMIAVIFVGLLTSEVPSEAEIWVCSGELCPSASN